MLPVQLILHAADVETNRFVGATVNVRIVVDVRHRGQVTLH